MPSNSSAPDLARGLRPTWVLVHPLFLGALLLLVVNDHALKGAGLLPGWLTGKLSDFAGLFVAVCLLSALLARRATHPYAIAAFLGAIFTAIKVHALPAAWLEAATALIGIPWTIVVDPTDLLALPALLAGARWITRPLASAGWTASRALSGTAAAIACMATSPPPADPTLVPTQFSAQVAILNDTHSELTIRLRPLRETVEIDCFTVVADPPAWLSEAVFGDAVSWIMPDRTMVSAWEDDPQGCYAALVEIDGADPQILYWDDDLPSRTYTTPLPEGQATDSQTIVVTMQSGQVPVVSQAAAADLLYELEADEPDEIPAECVLADSSERIDWADPVPAGEHTLVAAAYGADGCWRLDLGEGEGTGAEDVERWYLCLPPGTFPFEAGDLVELSDESGSGGAAPGRWEAVRLHRAGDVEADIREAELLATRGSGVPDLPNIDAVAFNAEDDCVPVFDDCGSASQAGYVAVDLGEEDVDVSSGESAIPAPGQMLHVIHVAEALVADEACGVDFGITIELVSVFTADAEEVTP